MSNDLPASAPEMGPALQSSQNSGDEEDVALLDILIVFLKYKKWILGFPLAVAILVAGYTLTMPNVFTATTKVLPPQGQSSSSGVLAQLSSVAGLVGGGAKGPSDVYVAILKSRTVADNLIKRFGLMDLYETKYPSQARQRLAAASNISAGAAKDGVITIDFDDVDPKRAAEISNAYVEELLKLTQVLAVTEASQRRLFFERQFALARDNLAKAEATAREGLQQGGLVKVDDQGRGMVEITARLRAQITVKEVQIGAMRTFASDGNPDLHLAQQEVESLKRELAKIEGAGGRPSSTATSSGNRGIDNLRLLRDVKYHEIIFELLGRQFELAKIDEAKDSSVVQVLDKAVEPDRKSKPVRSKIVLFSALGALIAAILAAFVREALRNAPKGPQHQARMQAVKRFLSWRN